MRKSSRILTLILFSILLILFAGCRASLEAPSRAPSMPTAIPPTPTPTPDPWVQAVADAQAVVAEADILDHFQMYQETAAQIDQYLIQLEKARPALDIIDRLKQTDLPIIGNLWEAVIKALDKAGLGAGEALKLVDEGVRELLAYHNRLQKLHDLEQYSIAIQQFQQAPSSETLVNMGHAMAGADDVLAIADQDVATIHDKIDSVIGAIALVQSGLAAAGSLNPHLQEGMNAVQEFINDVATPVQDLSSAIAAIQDQIAADRNAFRRIQAIIYRAEHPPTVAPPPTPGPSPRELPERSARMPGGWLLQPPVIFGGLLIILIVIIALLLVLRARGSKGSSQSSPLPPSSRDATGFVVDETIPYRPIRRSPPSPQPSTELATPMRLRVVKGKAAGRVYFLTKEDVLVGRGSTCDIQIPDPAVSRRHFRLRYAQGAWFLQDQNSTGGTFINGQKVMARRLQPNDEIRVGDHTLRFEPA